MGAAEEADEFADLSDEEYDGILIEIVRELTATELLEISGVYESLAERFHNDILTVWERRRVEE